MNWEKTFVCLVTLYLAIALPLYILNSYTYDKCVSACKAEGFDIVVSATGFEETRCRCMTSHTRNNIVLTIHPNGETTISGWSSYG